MEYDPMKYLRGYNITQIMSNKYVTQIVKFFRSVASNPPNDLKSLFHPKYEVKEMMIKWNGKQMVLFSRILLPKYAFLSILHELTPLTDGWCKCFFQVLKSLHGRS